MIEKYHLAEINKEAKFSIIIPTWNNLDILKLCIKAIRTHSNFTHQIIVHINDGSDGSLAWVQSQKDISYSYSKSNVGVCYAMNAMRTLVKTDYMVYTNDDMYLLPGWDAAFQAEIDQAESSLFFFSGTSLEPQHTGNNSVIAPADYGSTVLNFEEARLLKEFNDTNKEDWAGATWPPNIVATSTWDLVGGYSIEFSPGMYSDPDFSKKLWDAGVRNFKGLGNARAYHFMSKSVGRIKKNNGSKQFLMKWNMTSSTFIKHFIKRGKIYTGQLEQPQPSFSLKKALLKSKLKKLIS